MSVSNLASIAPDVPFADVTRRPKTARRQVRSLVVSCLAAGLITSAALLVGWMVQEVAYHREELGRVSQSVATRIDQEVQHAADLLRAMSLVPGMSGLEPDLCGELFRTFLDSDPIYTAIWRIQPDGLVTCSSLPMAEEIRMPVSERFAQAFDDGEPWLQPRVVGRQTGRITIGHGQAFGLDTDTPYLLAITIDAESLKDALVGYLPDHHAGLWVESLDGEVILRAGHFHSDHPPDHHLVRGESIVGPFRIYAVTETWDALAHLIYHWAVQCGLLLVLTLVMSGLLFRWARKSLSDPIDRLVVGVERIADGASDTLDPAAAGSLPEMRRIADAVAEMVRRLQERETRLRRANTKMERAERIGRMGSWQWDPYRDTFQLSGSASAILAIPKGDHVRRSSLTGLIDPKDREHWCKAFDDAREAREIIFSECRICVGDDRAEVITCYAEGHPTFDAAGHLLFYEGFIQDISAWKTTQSVLQDTISELRQAQTAQSNFLATASHEIRTPLNAISGYTEMLIGNYAGPLTATQQDYVGAIDSSAKRLNQLITNMLDLTALDAGDNVLQPAWADLGDVIAEAVAMSKPLAQSRDITVSDLTERPIEGWFDALRIGQVLSNLLSNAIKYNQVGGRVEVVATRDGEMARITVSDTGQGIAEDKLSEVMKPFRRANDGWVATEEGVGLGLAVVRSIAEAHGGGVELGSIVGQGTVAVVTLSLRRESTQSTHLSLVSR